MNTEIPVVYTDVDLKAGHIKQYTIYNKLFHANVHNISDNIKVSHTQTCLFYCFMDNAYICHLRAFI